MVKAFSEINFAVLALQLFGVWSVLKLLWLVVNKTEECKKFRKWFTKINKDTRYILVDHYGFSRDILYPAPVKRCKGCPKESTIYCPECKKRLCPGCNSRAHHPGTFTEAHPYEDIIYDVSKQGIYIITPILDYIVLFVVGQYVFTRASIGQDYLYSANTCPSLGFVQYVVASIDNSLFYYYKSNFGFYCGVEDSFWKLSLDLWVRTSIMESDNVVLLMTTLPQALLFQVAVFAVVVPSFAMIYALVKAVLYSVELRLALLPEPLKAVLQQVAAFTDTLCTVFQWINVFGWCAPFSNIMDYFYIGNTDSLPPVTKWRRRPNLDWGETYKYAMARYTRVMKYYQEYTRDNLVFLETTTTISVVVTRLLCIGFPSLVPIVRWILSLFVSSSVVSTHETWFKGSNTLVAADAWLSSALDSTAKRALGFATTLDSFFIWVLAAVFLFPIMSFVPGIVKNGKKKLVGFPDFSYGIQRYVVFPYNHQGVAGGLLVASALMAKWRMTLIGAVIGYYVLFVASVAAVHIQRRLFYVVWEDKEHPKSRWGTIGKDLSVLNEETTAHLKHIDEYGELWQQMTEDSGDVQTRSL